jgi:hypothetical protein
MATGTEFCTGQAVNQRGAVMGFRFRKRIKIMPGVWLNLSKSGVSTSLGGKGLTVNLKGGKAKTTVSLPGTGLSYSQTAPGHAGGAAPTGRATGAWLWILLAVLVGLGLAAIYSA